MRISAKGRYGLAAMINMARNYGSGEYITVISISEKLGISKIYLEQVFSLLKRGGLVTSVKGAQGGYQLTRTPRQITAYDILSAVEQSLLENTEDTVSEKAPEIDAALKALVFDTLDEAAKTALSGTTLYDLVHEADKHKQDQGLMFYI
jgi:Rrf2 family protein